MNYYQILEVEKNASNEQIRDSYKSLIKKYHPDVYKGNKEYAEKITKQLNDAYDTLSNPEKRAEYDALIFATPNSDVNSQTYGPGYKNSYQTAYNSQKQTRPTLTQKIKEKLYNFIDQKTKNLSIKSKLILFIIIIFFSLLSILISINDYLNHINL